MAFLLSNHKKVSFCIEYICMSSAFSFSIDKHKRVLGIQVSVKRKESYMYYIRMLHRKCK